MALVTIASSTNTASVISGDIERPLVGVWTADLQIDIPGGGDFTAGTQVTISSENGYSLIGVVDPIRTGLFLDAMHVRVIGGAGGIVSKTTTARGFVQPGAYVSDVLSGLCSDSGETLSSTVSAGLLTTNLAAWSVVAGSTVSRALRALIQIVAPTYSWRILADGTLWIGPETWPSASGTYDVLTQDPADGSFLIGSESPFIVPGTNLVNVGNVSRVKDTIADGKMSSRVWVDIPGTARGVNDSTQAMARLALPLVDYFALYDANVVAQSADLTTVDLQPADARLSGLQRVPLRLGLPGCKVQFSSGAVVRLGWSGGNPEKPYACLFNGGETIQSIQLGGAHPAVLWDTFRARLATELGKILGANGGGNILSDGGVTMATFLTALGAGAYDSAIVKNG